MSMTYGCMCADATHDCMCAGCASNMCVMHDMHHPTTCHASHKQAWCPFSKLTLYLYGSEESRWGGSGGVQGNEKANVVVLLLQPPWAVSKSVWAGLCNRGFSVSCKAIQSPSCPAVKLTVVQVTAESLYDKF